MDRVKRVVGIRGMGCQASFGALREGILTASSSPFGWFLFVCGSVQSSSLNKLMIHYRYFLEQKSEVV
ncbi:hypothetical protein V6N11_079264 [Hibiscus sabdariffa]|uniref:Uncharacterized protein n=1 Tax=Hibiscus sabdariffa TaxID=183260 RepID=A0ABR2RUW9_9ROSI